MEYRSLRNGTKVSVIGLGSVYFGDAGEGIRDIIPRAMDAGVNFMDTVMFDDTCTPIIRDAVREYGDGMRFQLQTGVHYPGHKYIATRDPVECREAFETELRKFGLDHADLLLFHYVDRPEDYKRVMSEGLYDMLVDWRDEGRVDNIGFSSHSAEVSLRFVRENDVDDIMFSLNPAYDFSLGPGGYRVEPTRAELYDVCTRKGTGIVVMKPFCGGTILRAETSPFGRAMTISQCIRYALDRPGAVTVVPGVGSVEQLDAVLGCMDASPDEEDYSFLDGITASDISDQCVYCNHCQPCPAGIDIGKVNKFSDLYEAGDLLAREHYMELSSHASNCIHCGRCSTRCPFDLNTEGHVAHASEVFGFRGHS